MPFAVIMLFDDATDHKVRAIWDALRQENIPVDFPEVGGSPHVSLALFDDIDREAFRERLQAFITHRKSFDICFSHVGTFGNQRGVIFLGPVPESELLDIHEAFHQTFDEFRPHFHSPYRISSDYYLPDQWVPHCTLANSLSEDQVAQAIKIACRFELPISGRIEHIGLIRYPPIEQIQVLDFK